MNIFAEMTKCFSFKSYRLFRCDTAGKNFLYMLVMTAIGFLLTVCVGIYMPLANMGGLDGIAEEIPDFSLSDDGLLYIDYQLDFGDGDTKVVIDTDYNYNYDESTDTIFRNNNGVREDVIDCSQYGQSAAVGKNMAVMCDDTSTDERVKKLEYTEIPVEYRSYINRDMLMELAKKLLTYFTIAMPFIIFIRLAIWSMVNAALGGCISSAMKVKNNFGQLYSMGLRAYTPVYFVFCLLSAFSVSVPFKPIILLIATGFILSGGIKAIKRQLEEEEQAAQQPDFDSDLAFRALYSEASPFDTPANEEENQ